MHYTLDTYELFITPTLDSDGALLYLGYRIQGGEVAHAGKSWLENIGDFTELFSRIMPQPHAIEILRSLQAGSPINLRNLSYEQLVLLHFNFHALDPSYVGQPRARGE